MTLVENQMTLLEKAKAAKKAPAGGGRRSSYDGEEIAELALAYAKGEIDGVQAKQALGGKKYASSVYQVLASALLTAVRRRYLRVERVKK